MKRPRVAVMLAAYQGELFIQEQLTSIIWQFGVNIKIYVRDDGSSDGTLAMLERVSAECPGVITIIDDAHGPQGSAALNFFKLIAAVDTDDFDYFAFADQDDIWAPTKIARAINVMEQSGSNGYSSSLLAYDAGAARAWVLLKNGPGKSLDYLFQGASAGCTYVLTKDAFALVKSTLAAVNVPWVYGISHDWVIYAICRSRGQLWAFDTHASIVYRQHDSNLYGARPGGRGLLSKLTLARDRWYGDHIRWLQHVVIKSDAENTVFKAMESKSIGSRITLFKQASDFRREIQHVRLLRLVIILGLLKPQQHKRPV